MFRGLKVIYTQLLVFRANTTTTRKLRLPKNLSRGLRTTNINRLRSEPFIKFASSATQRKTKHVVLALASFGLLSLMVSSTSSVVYAEAILEDAEEKGKGRSIRLSDIRDHGEGAERSWVIRGTSVYDITDWIPGHPGGEVILRAAGGSVDPYWKIFTIHEKQEVYDILEEYRIGTVDQRDLVDGQVPVDAVEDPFQNDPVRDIRLQVHSDRPCNAETPAPELSAFITPNAVFYVRNHLWVPEGDEESYCLVIDLGDGEEKVYTMKDLREKFDECKITATLHCSGNRRKHMTENSRATNGLQWDVGAIGNAEWAGPRLRDVLADAGLATGNPPNDAKHVQFVGAEAYGASIPIAKAVDPRGDVLLAYKMNGEQIPPDHGFPVRVVVPGHVAARSVKWVNKIVVADEESTSQWQRRDYKCFGPNEGANPDWDRARAIQELPVQSAITSVRDVSAHPTENDGNDSIAVEGYAFSGGGREIVRVDISVDDGRTWDQAELAESSESGSQHWSWKRWKYTAQKKNVGPQLLVKAVDEAYNTQPDSHEPTYNVRGNLAMAWHRLPYNSK